LSFPVLLAAQVFNILDFGAKDDGLTLNTSAIQAAIKKCKAAGGGTVWVPAGRFLTGTIFLDSDIELHLSPGATLLGSTAMKDYDAVHRHLIYAENAHNVSITGTGTIDGQGPAFYRGKENNFEAEIIRPVPWILFKNCRAIKVRDVNLIESPAHVLVLEDSDQAHIDGIRIYNAPNSPNTDGIDIKDTRNVLISNCDMSSGDDIICLKSEEDTVENVLVTNCILSSDDAALKMGTGSRAAIRNCQFSNITIRETRYGIALFMVDGGVYENCTFDNIIIETISRYNTEYPIYIDVDKRRAESKLGTVRDLLFSNIIIRSRGNVLVAGQKEAPLQSISFKNIRFQLTDVSDLSVLKKKPRGNKSFPTLPDMDDFSKVNGHFTFGHINGLYLDDISLLHPEKSTFSRKDLVLINTSDVYQNRFQVNRGKKTPLIEKVADKTALK
jgi:polygalacturonase